MKVYLFYNTRSEKEGMELYAITNKKKYAERFENERNMNHFIIEYEEMSKDEYINFCNNNDNRGCVLKLYKVMTVKNSMHTSKSLCYKNILMTHWEEQMIDEPVSYYDESNAWYGMPYPLIFNDEYVLALTKLQYVSYYKLMWSPYLMDDELNEKLFEYIGDDYAAPEIEIDQLSYFIQTCFPDEL